MQWADPCKPQASVSGPPSFCVFALVRRSGRVRSTHTKCLSSSKHPDIWMYLSKGPCLQTPSMPRCWLKASVRGIGKPY